MTRLALAPIAAALLLVGCAQTYVSPVSVTRFVGQAPARLGIGPIAVRAAPGMANSLEFAPYWQAVSTELTATLILIPTGVATLSTQFWQYQQSLSYGQAAPFALMIMAIAAVPSALLGRWFDRLPDRSA